MFAAGCTPLDIRMMGRWDSEVYRIYVHAEGKRAMRCTAAIGRQAIGSDAIEYDDEELLDSDIEI